MQKIIIGLAVAISIIGLLFVALVLYLVVVLPAVDNFNYERGKNGQFVQTCKELNGQEFTYENLKRLNGFVGVVSPRVGYYGYGYHYLEKRHVDDFRNGKYLLNDGKTRQIDKSQIRLDSNGRVTMAENGELNNHWGCAISVEKPNFKMTTESYFQTGD